jgi:hypothetical protein
VRALLAVAPRAVSDDEERRVVAAWLAEDPQLAPQYMNRAVQQLSLH